MQKPAIQGVQNLTQLIFIAHEQLQQGLGMRLFNHIPLRLGIAFITLTGISPAAHAQDSSVSFSDEVRSIWNRAMNGSGELYVPLHTWHNPREYSAEKIAQLNDNPWGIGYGKGFRDEAHNWHGFFVMEFKDSERHIEPVAAYGHTWNHGDGSTGWDFGLGYAASVTARKDAYSYHVPIPLVLPLVSAGIGKISLFCTYVPKLANHGGVAFFFGKATF